MTDTTRDAFEAWIRTAKNWKGDETIFNQFAGGLYRLDTVQAALDTWQAATLAAQRQPLSEEQLYAILLGVDHETKRLPPGFIEFARAIEAAHGITATPKKAHHEPL